MVVCLQCRRPGFDPRVGKISWRRDWQPTPVFLPGKTHAQRNMVGSSPWSHKELDTTERLIHTQIVWGFPGGTSGKEPTCRLRPYHPERARSRLISEAKQGRAWLVLGWENPPANAGDERHGGSILGLGRSLGGGHGNPLQYSCLENPMDKEAWWATVHRVTKSQMRLKQLSMHMCIAYLYDLRLGKL